RARFAPPVTSNVTSSSTGAEPSDCHPGHPAEHCVERMGRPRSKQAHVRHCTPVRLSRGGRSCQFGRVSATRKAAPILGGGGYAGYRIGACFLGGKRAEAIPPARIARVALLPRCG